MAEHDMQTPEELRQLFVNEVVRLIEVLSKRSTTLPKACDALLDEEKISRTITAAAVAHLQDSDLMEGFFSKPAYIDPILEVLNVTAKTHNMEGIIFSEIVGLHEAAKNPNSDFDPVDSSVAKDGLSR